MTSHVYIGMYDALREAGVSETKALAALAELPVPQHLATKDAVTEGTIEVSV